MDSSYLSQQLDETPASASPRCLVNGVGGNVYVKPKDHSEAELEASHYSKAVARSSRRKSTRDEMCQRTKKKVDGCCLVPNGALNHC